MTRPNPVELAAMVLAAVLGCGLAGCGGSGGKTPVEKAPPSTPAPAAANSGPDLDLNCVINNLQKPQDAFHYSFTRTGSNGWEEDAYVSPTLISGKFINPALPQPHTFQGTPQQVWNNLMAIASMSSYFALVHSSSAMTRAGSESASGYDAVKFTIDTSTASVDEKGLYTATLGPGGFEKGTVWVRADGCPVKIDAVEELHFKDGRPPDNVHYQEAMVKATKP